MELQKENNNMRAGVTLHSTSPQMMNQIIHLRMVWARFLVIAALALCPFGCLDTIQGANPDQQVGGLVSARATSPPRDYKFDRTISRAVLENYLSRSISMEGVFNGRGDLDDNIRMLTTIGAKYIGRSLCLWGAEANFLPAVARAKAEVPKML